MNRKQYSSEFKNEAIRLILVEGVSVPEVAEQLGVSAGRLRIPQIRRH
ncbi:MAG: transposase [Verrucomicrobiota bacterium]